MTSGSKQDYREYALAWRKRHARQKEERETQRQQALRMARRVADELVHDFNAQEVWLFGSILREDDYFDEHSDIDLATRGIPPTRHFEALGVISQRHRAFRFDLVPLEDCMDSLRNTILREGRRLV